MPNPTALSCFQQGLTLSSQSQWLEAIAAWRKALVLEPNYIEAHFNLGVGLRQLKQYEEAILAYQKVIALSPNHDKAYFSLGNVYLDQRQFDRGITCYSKAIQINPQNADYYFQLGIACHLRRLTPQAIQCFRKVLELTPDREDARTNLAKLLSGSPSQENSLEASFELGVKCYQAGNWVKALEVFQQVTVRHPTHVGAHFNLALTYRKLERWEEAKNSALQVLELDPKHLRAHRFLADFYVKQGEANLSIGHYLQAQALEPSDRWTKYALRSAEWQREIQLRLGCHPKQCPAQSFAVLHVGCGPKNPFALAPVFRTSAWKEVRLDIDPRVEPDVIGSITDLSAVADNSMDALYSSHNLEHIFREEVPRALAEFFRVLKPGRIAMITLPDIQTIAQFVAEGKLEEPIETYPSGAQITAIHALFGEADGFMLHRTGFTDKTLQQKLILAGFTEVTVCREGINLWSKAYKP